METDWVIYIPGLTMGNHSGRIIKYSKEEMQAFWMLGSVIWFSEAPSSLINKISQEKLDKREDVNYQSIV